MPTGYLLSTASLYVYSLSRTMQVAQEAGFDGLEISLDPGIVRLPPAQVRTLAQEHELTLASLHPPTIPLPGWGSSTRGLQRLAGLARALECPILVLHAPDAQSESDPRLQDFYRVLDTVQEALVGSAATVALENRNRQPGTPLGPLDDPAGLLKLCRRRGCNVILDTAHAHTLPFPLLETYAALRPLLVNIHLSDVVPGSFWTRFSYPRSLFSHHRPPGQGVLPLRQLLTILGEHDYDGWITLELSPLALPLYSRPALVRAFQDMLQCCRKWVQG
ncbi:MAG: TIM barrel protein [Chloroflexia bacterium]|nr:TIM barrel protein [Chloroflexia bacterium]